MIEYKGYIGKVEFDDEAEIFHGEVINLSDVVTFQGESVQDLREALRDSVEDYLEFCAERGEKPELPFSGELTVQILPELHRDLYIQARRYNKSLNSWVNEIFENAVTRMPDMLVTN